MTRFHAYNPEQSYLLPPNVKDVLGGDHLCFFVHAVVERLDLNRFLEAYGEEGGALYHPALMLKVWLYAYLLGVTSARRLEQRIREDLAFGFLAGGGQPDYWALNEFRRRHGVGINSAFVQVLEMAQELGLARLGAVAIDSTRVKANASADHVDRVRDPRQERARKRRQVRQWQKACAGDDPNEGAGTTVGTANQVLQEVEVPRRLARLPKVMKRSRTDPDSRFLRERGGRFVLGYTGEVAVSEDHFIVAARVTQNAHDVHALVPMTDEVERVCRARPQRVLADSGFNSTGNLQRLEQRGIDSYVPDPNLAREINCGQRAEDDPRFHCVRQRMRCKLRTAAGRRIYDRRKALVEPVFGVLKEQRGMRCFRMRGLAKVSSEWMLAVLAYNLGRLHMMR